MCSYEESTKHIVVSRVEIGESRLGGGRGVYLTEAVCAGEVVFEVKKEGVLTGATFADILGHWVGGGRRALADTSELSRDAMFCIPLMLLRPYTSHPIPTNQTQNEHIIKYIATLPTSSPCYLDFANDREIQILENKMRRAKLEERRTLLRTLFLEVQQYLTCHKTALCKFFSTDFIAENTTAGSLLWAYGVLSSRAFNISETTGFGLVPYGDMFNHSSEGIHDFGMSDNGETFYFKASHDLPKGAEIFLRYNTWMGHFHFALHYGFVPVCIEKKEGNIAIDTADLPTQRYLITLPHENVHRSESVANSARDRLVYAYECENGGLYEDGLVDAKTLKGLRFLRLPSSFEGLDKAVRGEVISLENELCAYSSLVGILREELAQYSTTVSEDLTVMTSASCQLPPAVQLGVTVRLLDKRLLLKSLNNSLEYQRKLADTAYLGVSVESLPTPPPCPSPLPKPSSHHLSSLVETAFKALNVAEETAAPVAVTAPLSP